MLGLILPLAMLVVGVHGFLGLYGPRLAGALLVLLAAVAIVISMKGFAVNFVDDGIAQMRQEGSESWDEQKLTGKALDDAKASLEETVKKTREDAAKETDMGTGGGVWLFFIFSVLTAACGVLSFMRMGCQCAAPAASPAAPAPPPSA